MKTNDYIYKSGSTPNTKVAISSKTKLFGYAAEPFGNLQPGGLMTQIGVVSSHSPSQSRANEPVRGIGFGDQIAELVPGMSDPASISLSRAALYLANVFQTLGYRSGVDGLVRAIKHHKWPFDLKEEQVFSALAQASNGLSGLLENATNFQSTITFYEGCWVNSYSYTVSADTAVIMEDVTVDVTDITDGSIDDILTPFVPTGLEGKSRRFGIVAAAGNTLATSLT